MNNPIVSWMPRFLALFNDYKANFNLGNFNTKIVHFSKLEVIDYKNSRSANDLRSVYKPPPK